MAIFIGANGTGKSTLFGVFNFLHDAVRYNVTQALALRGGFKELISRGCSEKDSIVIELTLLAKIEKKERLLTYRFEIKSNKITIIEKLTYTPDDAKEEILLQCTNGKGWATACEFKEKPVKKERHIESDGLMIGVLGYFKVFQSAAAFRNFIIQFHLSNFHISQAQVIQNAGYAEYLSATREQLSLIARVMLEKYPDIFEEVLEKMKSCVPGITDVKAEITVDGRTVLRFSDAAFIDPFLAKNVSDGTIKVFACLIMLYNPKKYSLLCIEEPENQLYPSLLNSLLEEFRLYAKRKSGSQVFMSSHSPHLLTAARFEEVYWLVKEKGFTIIKRAKNDEKVYAHLNAGDTLGELWTQNYLDGANPK